MAAAAVSALAAAAGALDCDSRATLRAARKVRQSSKSFLLCQA